MAALIWTGFVWSPLLMGGIGGGLLMDAAVLALLKVGRRIAADGGSAAYAPGRRVPTVDALIADAPEATSLATTSGGTDKAVPEAVERVGKRRVIRCAGCGGVVEREDREALRVGGWWHRSCWTAEAERRRPMFAAVRRANEERYAIAELIRLGEERRRLGFEVSAVGGVLRRDAYDIEG